MRLSLRDRSGFCCYLVLRMRFVLHAARDFLIRRWIFLVALVFLSPGIPLVSIVLNFSRLVERMVSGPDGVGSHIRQIVLLQCFCVFWTKALSPILRGGPFRMFLNTLPIEPGRALWVSAVICLVLDLPLLAPLVGGLVLSAIQGPAFFLISGPGACLFVVATILVQAAVLEAMPVLLLALAAADCALGFAFAPGPVWIRALALIGAVWPVLQSAFLARYGACLLPRFRSRRLTTQRTDLLMRLGPVTRLQIRTCLQKGTQVSRSLVCVTLLPLGLWQLCDIFAWDGRCVPVGLIVMGLSAQFSLPLFDALWVAHNRAAAFFRTLPVPVRFWLWRDLVFVCLAFVLPVVLFILPLALHRLLTPAALGLIGLSFFLLLGALRLVLCVGSGWRSALSLGASSLWILFVLWGVFS